MSEPRRWGSRWPLHVLIAAAATIVAGGFAEAGLHVAGVAPDPALFTVSEREFRRVPGIYSPGQRVVVQPNTEFEHVVTINNLGYRGADLPLEKPPGEVRILFAGDSFTWGHNVQDDETLPARLEATLASHCGRVRVANAGLSGSSMLGQSEMILRGLAISPDLVVVMYHENDIGELVHTRIWEQLAGNRRAKSKFPLGLIYPLVRETALWNLALQATHSWRIEAGLQGMERDVNEAAATDAARDEYRSRLAAVADTLRFRGIPFVFAAYPHPESVTAGRAAPDYYWALDVARGLGLPVVDLMPVLEASGLSLEEAFLVPLDYHPTPAGHEVAARAIGTTAAGLLTRCR